MENTLKDSKNGIKRQKEDALPVALPRSSGRWQQGAIDTYIHTYIHT
jgi:hypothetical protein